VVWRILAATGSELKRLIGDTSVLSQLDPEAFTDAVFGVPTVADILRELEKPGRDSRPAFKTANFLEGVEKLEDLKPGMVLEGVVTNVAAFGAFVDVGVHQDGFVLCLPYHRACCRSLGFARDQQPAPDQADRCAPWSRPRFSDNRDSEFCAECAAASSELVERGRVAGAS
jgi:hypothetical protein